MTLVLCFWPEDTFDPAKLTSFPRLHRLEVTESNVTDVLDFPYHDHLEAGRRMGRALLRCLHDRLIVRARAGKGTRYDEDPMPLVRFQVNLIIPFSGSIYFGALHDVRSQELILSGLRLTWLGDDVFSGLRRLRVLDISRNQLSVLGSATLLHPPSLQRVMLGGRCGTGLATARIAPKQNPGCLQATPGAAHWPWPG